MFAPFTSPQEITKLGEYLDAPVLEVPQDVFDAWEVALGVFPDRAEELGHYMLYNERRVIPPGVTIWATRRTLRVGMVYITPIQPMQIAFIEEGEDR